MKFWIIDSNFGFNIYGHILIIRDFYEKVATVLKLSNFWGRFEFPYVAHPRPNFWGY